MFSPENLIFTDSTYIDKVSNKYIINILYYFLNIKNILRILCKLLQINIIKFIKLIFNII